MSKYTRSIQAVESVKEKEVHHHTSSCNKTTVGREKHASKRIRGAASFTENTLQCPVGGWRSWMLAVGGFPAGGAGVTLAWRGNREHGGEC